jgi:putative hydrolases of HD superfamily
VAKTALYSIVNDLGNVEVANEIRELWFEYEEGVSIEADLARQLDKFEMIVQANEYEISQNKLLQRFYDSTNGIFTHPEVS